MIIVSRINGHPLEAPGLEIFDNEDVNGLKMAIEKTLDRASEEEKSIKHSQRDYVKRVFDVNLWSESVVKSYMEIIN
jgi:hypothetical protein